MPEYGGVLDAELELGGPRKRKTIAVQDRVSNPHIEAGGWKFRIPNSEFRILLVFFFLVGGRRSDDLLL